MRAIQAFRVGLGRVATAPVMLIGAYVTTVLVALPFALILRSTIEDHLGRSLAAEAAASSVNYPWWQEFSAQASGLGRSFTPSVIGFGAVLGNLSAFFDNRWDGGVVLAAVALSLAVWTFLTGGIIDRYARNRRTRAAGFFAACGVYFFRFLRLGLLAGLGYYLLFRYLHTWLLDDLYTWATRDMTVEQQGFFVRVGLYGLFGAAIGVFNLVLDYSKIRAVVEDRRSMVGALRAGARFVRRHPACILLYLVNGLVFVGLVSVYGAVAPDVTPAGAAAWSSFVIGQTYVLGRHVVKLQFYASQIAFFQAALAHAEYTAAPQHVWPESPAVEALSNGVR
jgi:hypothetical protein